MRVLPSVFYPRMLEDRVGLAKSVILLPSRLVLSNRAFKEFLMRDSPEFCKLTLEMKNCVKSLMWSEDFLIDLVYIYYTTYILFNIHMLINYFLSRNFFSSHSNNMSWINRLILQSRYKLLSSYFKQNEYYLPNQIK